MGKDSPRDHKVKKGYALVEGVTAAQAKRAVQDLAPPNEVERALFAEGGRDDVQAWLVFGDWLSSRGDARGKAIALSFGDHRAELEELIATHEQSWLGGRFDSVGVGKGGWSPPSVIIEWVHGFMHHAEIGEPFASLTHDQLRQFLAAPATRFLHELTLGDDQTGNASLLREARLPALRHARVRRARSDFQDYLTALPNLISCRGSGSGTTCLRHDELRSLSLSLSRTSTPIGLAKLPKLESLRVTERGGLDTDNSCMPILTGELNSLKHLRLSIRDADVFIRGLVKSPLLGQLERLELLGSHLSVDGARDLIKHRDAFAHLQLLSVPGVHGVMAELRKVKVAGKLLLGPDPELVAGLDVFDG